MSNIGKILPIVKEFPTNNGLVTMQSNLAAKGMTRVPGTGVYKYPYKELDGSYRTGLDPDAAYIQRILDETAKKIEIERVTKLRKKLEKMLSLDLSPRSRYWNHALAQNPDDFNHVQPVKLIDSINVFDLSVPIKELQFAWLRVHPTIASSLMAYRNGEYPSNTQWYVADEAMENEILFKKKENVNKAVIAFSNMTPEKRKKVARLMGFPISENTLDSVVYNTVDSALKKEEMEVGQFKGLSSLQLFNRIMSLNDKTLEIKDVVRQAIEHSIYRVNAAGRVYQGQNEVAESEESLVIRLSDEKNQEEYILLNDQLKSKKLAAV